MHIHSFLCTFFLFLIFYNLCCLPLLLLLSLCVVSFNVLAVILNSSKNRSLLVPPKIKQKKINIKEHTTYILHTQETLMRQLNILQTLERSFNKKKKKRIVAFYCLIVWDYCVCQTTTITGHKSTQPHDWTFFLFLYLLSADIWAFKEPL